MIDQVHETSTQVLSRLQVRVEEPVDPMLQEGPPSPDFSRLQATTVDPASAAEDEFEEEQPVDTETATLTRQGERRTPGVDPNDPSTGGKVSRNSPCPCGSG